MNEDRFWFSFSGSNVKDSPAIARFYFGDHGWKSVIFKDGKMEVLN